MIRFMPLKKLGWEELITKTQVEAVNASKCSDSEWAWFHPHEIFGSIRKQCHAVGGTGTQSVEPWCTVKHLAMHNKGFLN